MKQMARKLYVLGFATTDFKDWCIKVDNSEVKADIDSYIERFGDRCLDELKLESITLFDNPELLYQTLFELSQNEVLMSTEEKWKLMKNQKKWNKKCWRNCHS